MKTIARNKAECKPASLSWENPRAMVLWDMLLRALIMLQEQWRGAGDGRAQAHRCCPSVIPFTFPHLQVAKMWHDWIRILRTSLQWWHRGWNGGSTTRAGRPARRRVQYCLRGWGPWSMSRDDMEAKMYAILVPRRKGREHTQESMTQ